MRRLFFFISFVFVLSISCFADDLYITYTMPAIRSSCDGYAYDTIFDSSGNSYNVGSGAVYPASSWWYMTYAMPKYSGTGSVAMKEHLTNFIQDSTVLSVSGFSVAGENSSGGLGTWFYPGVTVQKSNSNLVVVNNRNFYVVSNDISFTAYSSYGLAGTDFVRLGHQVSRAVRLGFDAEIVYNGPLFCGSLTMICPYEVTPDNLVTVQNLNNAVADLKASMGSATSVDYSQLLQSIDNYCSRVTVQLESLSTSSGATTIRWYLDYILQNLQSISSSNNQILSVCRTLSATISSIDSHLSSIDANLQIIVDDIQARDDVVGAAAGAASDDAISNTGSQSSTGISSISSSASAAVSDGGAFDTVSKGGYLKFLGACMPSVLTAYPASFPVSMSSFFLAIIPILVLLAILRKLLGSDSDSDEGGESDA